MQAQLGEVFVISAISASLFLALFSHKPRPIEYIITAVVHILLITALAILTYVINPLGMYSESDFFGAGIVGSLIGMGLIHMVQKPLS